MDHKEYFARVATHTLTGTYDYRDLVMLVLKLLQKLTTRQVHNMKLTQRGRVVAYFVAVTALLLIVHFLDNHYRITTCRQLAEGWTCNTTWKG